MLLDAGADPDAVSVRGKTPLALAIEEAHLDIIRLLLKSGADPNVTNKNGGTPLHRAASEGLNKVVGMLLNAGANPNIVDKFSHSPVICAARVGHVTIVEMLRSHGADVTHRSREGLTADEWLEIGGLFGYMKKQFPADHPSGIGKSLVGIADERAEQTIRKMMAECADPDEFAARHGRNILVFSYGLEKFRDPDLERYAHRVWEIIKPGGSLDECEERFLTGEDLAQARKQRIARNRYAKRSAAKQARMAECRV